MNCQMVLNNIKKKDSILFEVFASVFTVSSNFTDNPRIMGYKKHIQTSVSLYVFNWLVKVDLKKEHAAAYIHMSETF